MNLFFCNRKLHILLFMILSGFALNVSATPKIYTLKEAIYLSLRYNPNVKIAELNRIVDKFNLAIAKNAFEFQYALVGGATTNRGVVGGVNTGLDRNLNVTSEITQKNIFGTEYSLTMENPWAYNSLDPRYSYTPSLNLSIAQPLLRGSGTEVVGAPLKQAYLTDAIARLNLKNAIMTQVNLIITDYLALINAESQLYINQDALKNAEDTVKQNNVRIRIGLMAPAENDQAKASAANAELSVSQALNLVIQSRLQILQDIGLPPDTPFHVVKKIDMKGITYPKGEEAKQLLYANNISYLIAISQLKISKLNMILAEDGQRWDLKLIGTVTQGPGFGFGENAGINSLFNGLNQNRALALAFNIPIDNLGIQSAMVNAKVAYTQAKLAFKQLKLTLDTQVIGNLENLKILQKQIIISERAEKLADLSYKTSLIKLKYGQVSVFEVTSLQSSLAQAQLNTVLNQLNYVAGVSQFQQTLGITLDFWKIKLVY